MIYTLKGEYTENSLFIEDFPDTKESIQGIALEQNWNPFKNYTPVKLELHSSDTGKKNYKFDFSGFLSPFLIFSENALSVLDFILTPRGQYLDIITSSKRKKYFGYYPTNVYPKGILDLEKSVYSEYPNGLLIRKPVLIKDKIPDDYLFTIEEDISRIFVTEKFRKLVEEHNLIGFEFSEYNTVELS